MIRGRHSKSLRATVLRSRPLVYGDPAKGERPPFVRAGSAVVRTGAGAFIVQDDAMWAGVLRDGVLSSVPLPADGPKLFPPDKAGKRAKPDFEAALLWGRHVFAIGSGAKPARELAMRIELSALQATRIEIPELFSVFRGVIEGRCNIEGAFPHRGAVRFLHRGNDGDGDDVILDVHSGWADALAAGVSTMPALTRTRGLRLGKLDGVRLTVTDGLSLGDRFWFCAAAEDTEDAIEDGDIAGSAIGWCDDEDARWAVLRYPDGRTFRGKVEGLARGDMDGHFVGVTDPDDPHVPAEWVAIEVG